MRRFLPLLLFIWAGFVPDRNNLPDRLSAYVPVYASRQAVSDIGVSASRSTANAEKIYDYGTYLFQVEQYEGIHIIDNTIPKQAHKIAFLKVPLCTEIAIKSNHLYTNNLNDLVVFNIDDAASPRLVKRLADAFPEVNQMYPPLTGVYFECVNPSKGIVVQWEQKMMQTPSCRR